MAEERPSSQHASGSYIAQADRGSTATVNVFNTLPRRFVDPGDRSNLLKLVKASWISGVLTASLNQTLAIQLNKEIQVGAVERPEAARLAALHQQSSAISPNKKMLEIFEEMGHTLLILGGAGAGKTITMLQLASEAITSAEQNASQPIPVIFNLSSWTNPKQRITDWLASELRIKYATPLKIGRLLIEKDALLVLLDGLDEVKPELQQACVAAINHYRDEHRGGLVVCCRKDEYETLINQHQIKLQFGGAILLHPLTLQQIDEYLTQVGPTFSALRTAIQKEMILQELAQSPLMLSIMCVVYQNISVDTLITEQLVTSPDMLRKYLFDIYVERMFRQRISRTFGSHEVDILEEDNTEQSKKMSYSREQTLNWLSWLAYKMSSQKEFLIEQMQPNWLLSGKMYWMYVLGVCLSVELIILLAFLPFLIFSELSGHSGGILVGLMIFCITFVISAWRAEANIQTIDVLHWSWSPFTNKKKIVWLFLLVLCFCLALPYVFFIVGLHGRIEEKIRPGQGIRQSAKYALIMGVFNMLVFPISVGTYLVLILRFIDPSNSVFTLSLPTMLLAMLLAGAIFAPIIGISVGLYYGGFACIKHLMLRLVLSLNHLAPWNYVHFLDYAVEHIFLRRIGGGYIFIHRQFQGYFAAKYNGIMESSSSRNSSRFLANLFTKKSLRTFSLVGLGLILLFLTLIFLFHAFGMLSTLNNPFFFILLIFSLVAGMMLSYISWVAALIKTMQSRQWGWFVCLLVFGNIALLVYIFVGPETPRDQSS